MDSSSAAAMKGGAFLLLLLISLPFISSLGEEPPSLLDRQESQLKRLETLVDTLTQTVSRLESSLSKCCPPSPDAPSLPTPPQLEMEPRPSVILSKPSQSWSDWFRLAASSRLEPYTTCAAPLPFEDFAGAAKYFAVGSSRGSVSVFSSAGDAMIEIPPPSDRPAIAVTAILSYLSFRRNETLIFAGHADGSIIAHRVSELASKSGGWLTLSLSGSQPFVFDSAEMNSLPVISIELHQIGRTRYIIASESGGRIRFFMENGNLYGTAVASKKPLAFSKQRLLFLTESGAGSIDLRSMVVKETDCEGLNGSAVEGYSFDALERSKAYGFTTGGDLVHAMLLGDASNLKCRIRVLRKSEIERPVSIQAIRGHLLIVSESKIFVYNVSSQYYGRVGTPRLLFFADLHEIKPSFSNSPSFINGFSSGSPLIAADQEKTILLGFGDGCIGVYRTNFPILKAESNAVVWSSQALLFFLFLMGVWKFYVKKKDSLGWTSEEFFATSAVSGDGAYADSTRAADLRETRGVAIRDPPRRFGSPTSRYPGGAGMPFRPKVGDAGFRGVAELRYRGQHLEAADFSQRREPLFKNSKVIDDPLD